MRKLVVKSALRLKCQTQIKFEIASPISIKNSYGDRDYDRDYVCDHKHYIYCRISKFFGSRNPCYILMQKYFSIYLRVNTFRNWSKLLHFRNVSLINILSDKLLRTGRNIKPVVLNSLSTAANSWLLRSQVWTALSATTSHEEMSGSSFERTDSFVEINRIDAKVLTSLLS